MKKMWKEGLASVVSHHTAVLIHRDQIIRHANLPTPSFLKNTSLRF